MSDDEDLIGPVGDHDPRTRGIDRVKAEWDARRAAEEAGQKYADELRAQPEDVLRAALYQLANDSPRLYLIAQHGPSKEALDVEDEVHKLRVRQRAREELAVEQGERADPPALINLTAFLQQPDEEVRYRVDGLWPSAGRVLLAAQYKSGKTTLVNNLIRSLVDGDAFLDTFTVEPVKRVVLIDNELSQAMIRYWLREQGIRKTDAVDVVSLRGALSSFNLLDPTVRVEWAKAIGPADALIFDCLRPVLDSLGLSEDKEAGRFLTAFDEFAREAGISETFLVHHMGHTNERSRGDSRLLDWPDAVWKIVRKDPDDAASPRYFSAYGRDVDQPEVGLAYTTDNRHVSVSGGSRKQASAGQIKADVQLWVREHPGCSQNNIEENVEGRNASIREAIHDMVRTESIRIEKQGRAHLHYEGDGGAASDFADDVDD